MILTTIPTKTIMSNTFEFFVTVSPVFLYASDKILITQGLVPVK